MTWNVVLDAYGRPRVKWMTPSTSETMQSSWVDIKVKVHWIAVYIQSMSTKWVTCIDTKWKDGMHFGDTDRCGTRAYININKEKCTNTPIPMTIKGASAILFYVFFTFPHLNVSKSPFRIMPKAVMISNALFDKWSTKKEQFLDQDEDGVEATSSKRDGNTHDKKALEDIGDLPSYKKDIPPLQILHNNQYQYPRLNLACCKGLLSTFSYNTRFEKPGCLHYHRRCVQRVFPGWISRLLYSGSSLVRGIYSLGYIFEC